MYDSQTRESMFVYLFHLILFFPNWQLLHQTKIDTLSILLARVSSCLLLDNKSPLISSRYPFHYVLRLHICDRQVNQQLECDQMQLLMSVCTARWLELVLLSSVQIAGTFHSFIQNKRSLPQTDDSDWVYHLSFQIFKNPRNTSRQYMQNTRKISARWLLVNILVD